MSTQSIRNQNGTSVQVYWRATAFVHTLQCMSMLVFTASIVRAQPAVVRASLPVWAESQWQAFAQTEQLRRVDPFMQSMLSGDFDGDGTRDIAIIVEQLRTRKTGIVFLHRGSRTYVVGAGRALGNGGDDFRWMDSWKLATPLSKGQHADQLLIEREGAASGMIYFARGRYRWKQLGD